MGETSGWHIDIRESDGLDRPPERSAPGQQPWVGIHFDCCGRYARVYRNAEGTAYEGRCPDCLRTVRLRVGPGGTSSRFFTAR